MSVQLRNYAPYNRYRALPGLPLGTPGLKVKFNLTLTYSQHVLIHSRTAIPFI